MLELGVEVEIEIEIEVGAVQVDLASSNTFPILRGTTFELVLRACQKHWSSEEPSILYIVYSTLHVYVKW